MIVPCLNREMQLGKREGSACLNEKEIAKIPAVRIELQAVEEYPHGVHYKVFSSAA